MACRDVVAPIAEPREGMLVGSAQCALGALMEDTAPAPVPWEDLQDALHFARTSLVPAMPEDAATAELALALDRLMSLSPLSPQVTCDALADASRAWEQVPVTPASAHQSDALRMILQLVQPYTHRVD